MVCAHCGHDHLTKNCTNFCKLCEVVGHRQKSANCQFHVCSKCNTVGHSARACKAPQLQQRMVRGEREPENDLSQSDAPMATDSDRHADDDDDECDQLNSTNDHEPDDDMSTDDDAADREVNDHNDEDDDDDVEVALNGGDVPVCKSCGNFGHRTQRDHRWGETREGQYPSFLSIAGVSYYRLLNAGANGPLQSYIYDTNYQLDGLKISDHVRNIVKDCIRTKNDVASNLTQLGQRTDVKETTLHLESNVEIPTFAWTRHS